MHQRTSALLSSIAALTLGACRPDYDVEVPADRGRVVVVSNPEDPRSLWSRAALPGADIRIEWWAKVDALVDNGWACVRSRVVQSDARGNFDVPAWRNHSRSVYDVEWRAFARSEGHVMDYAMQDSQDGLPGYGHTVVMRRANPGEVAGAMPSGAHGEFACWDEPART